MDRHISAIKTQALDVYLVPSRVYICMFCINLRTTKKLLKDLELDAGIYHNGALIHENGNKKHGFQINNSKEIVNKILSSYPDALIAVESNDILYSNFDAEKLWPGTSYTLTESNFSEIEDEKADKIIVVVSFLSDMKKYEIFLSEDLYIIIIEI